MKPDITIIPVREPVKLDPRRTPTLPSQSEIHAVMDWAAEYQFPPSSYDSARELLERAYEARQPDPLAEELADALKRCPELVPTNWCDPLLTGPEAVISDGNHENTNISALLVAVKTRLEAHVMCTLAAARGERKEKAE